MTGVQKQHMRRGCLKVHASARAHANMNMNNDYSSNHEQNTEDRNFSTNGEIEKQNWHVKATNPGINQKCQRQGHPGSRCLRRCCCA